MTAIQYLKGVGPKKAELLGRLGLETVEDLLFYFPRKWEDRRLGAKPENLPFIEKVSVLKGRIVLVKDLYTSGRLRIFKTILDTGAVRAEVSWFRRHSPRFDVFGLLRKDLKEGAEVWVVGEPEDPLFKTRLRGEEYYLDGDASAKLNHIARLVPVYPLTAGLSAKLMREISRKALQERGGAVGDFLPAGLLSKRGLFDRVSALRALHFPENGFQLTTARKRFIYEELFLMALAWALKRRQTLRVLKGFGYEVKKHLLTPFKERLGFEFTNDQKRAINAIFADMRAPSPMARLLEGDVGSGKTVVALSALLLAVENGGQGVFLAPTEILAEQHYLTFHKFLDGLKVNFALLTSSVRPKEKKKIIERLAAGEIDILIGTHAALEEGVKFKNLRLTVIDEQHRFGVRQRAALRLKGDKADMLVMTATPIPRTLFLALYGDLDLSVLKEMPPGRQPVKTELADEFRAFEAVREELLKGRQAYIVYPVIEEDGARGLKSVKEEFARLKGIFKNVDMLHGRMPSELKKKVMDDFVSGKSKVLVATQVIEVGIDVPNATVMVINNAENYGLASLHQLRGRVGRGKHGGRCLLVTGQAVTEDGGRRLDALRSSSSGFELSEKDIYMRGAGDILGLRQHGDMDFKIADLSRDSGLLEAAIADREELLRADPDLRAPQNAGLRRKLIELYGKKWSLIDLS
ncbi:MAG TPA: ATP-dependent DNA helicase RecG [Elusimicrobia bacterium]|nr:ATP-dependent DNA helicase RecG [Elusimicrobiota bacterium]